MLKEYLSPLWKHVTLPPVYLIHWGSHSLISWQSDELAMIGYQDSSDQPQFCLSF